MSKVLIWNEQMKNLSQWLIWKTILGLIQCFMYDHNTKYNTDFIHSGRWLKYCSP